MAVVVNDIGAIGAVVSTIREKAVEACEVLPAASVAFAVIECVPSLSAVEGEKKNPLHYLLSLFLRNYFH